jgi:ATP-dependent RNA helicase RhlE
VSPIINTKQSKPCSHGFKTFSLESHVLRGVEEAGFSEPRPIQAQAIPAVLAGRDVLGLAQTGTGKTAAFALPILSRFAAAGNSKGAAPRALILAPTRELATQIEREINLLGRFTNVRSTVVFGGMPITRQVRALSKRPDIVVACPGRLLDLHKRREIDLRGIEIVVLDEADHMFDMGFLPDIKRILGALPARRQNLLFSATMPQEIRRLTDGLLRDPHVVELSHSAPADTIEHALYPCTDGFKQDLLKHLLEEPGFTSAIVFLRTKSRAQRLAERLVRAGEKAVALQGNMNQSQRDRAMRGFREGRYKVLVATDIAARGIDVEGISHVINFDVPNTPDAYTHRIGRTGRSERSGKACTFVTGQDRSQIRAIEARIGAEIPCVRLPAFGGAQPKKARAGKRERSGEDARAGAGQAHGQRGAGPWQTRTAAGRGGKPPAHKPERSTGAGAASPAAAASPPVAARPGARGSWQSGKGWDQQGAQALPSDRSFHAGSPPAGSTVGRRARKRIRRSQPAPAASGDADGGWSRPGGQGGSGGSGGNGSSSGNWRRGRSAQGRGRSAHARDRAGF